VLVMYWPRAFSRGGSVQIVLSALMLSTSSVRRFRAYVREGQWRIACLNVSCLVPHRGQVSERFSSNQEGCAVR